MNIKVVRVFWGNSERLKQHAINAPRFNEIVIVYGVDNYKFLLEQNYDCILVSNDDKSHIPFHLMFYLKLEGLVIAGRLFEKILFLDWDVSIVKPLDADFWSSLESKRFAAPVYAWADNLKLHKGNEESVEMFNIFDQMLLNNCWNYQNYRVIPNTCFIYISHPEIAQQLLTIHQNNQFISLIEEFCIFKWANCSLEEYILEYEPCTIFASEDDSPIGEVDWSEVRDTHRNLNDYVRQLITKDIYLKHH